MNILPAPYIPAGTLKRADRPDRVQAPSLTQANTFRGKNTRWQT